MVIRLWLLFRSFSFAFLRGHASCAVQLKCNFLEEVLLLNPLPHFPLPSKSFAKSRQISFKNTNIRGRSIKQKTKICSFLFAADLPLFKNDNLQTPTHIKQLFFFNICSFLFFNLTLKGGHMQEVLGILDSPVQQLSKCDIIQGFECFLGNCPDVTFLDKVTFTSATTKGDDL